MDAITINQATDMVVEYIRKYQDHDFIVMNDKTKEYEFGWVFFYAPRRAIEERNKNFMVPGAGPIAVNRDGHLYELGTSVPPAQAIETYLRQWKRHK